jgi:DNA-binding transcriptional LysR family regulator
MGDQIIEMRAFSRVAETGSFSKAARELGISQSTASRLVAELEVRLGAKLLLRTTHQVVATDAGSAFLGHALGILDNLDAAADAARGAESLHGVLHVATPSSFGTQVVVPILVPFLIQHPQLRIELMPFDEAEDLIAKRVDIAIRFGSLPDSDFGARQLAIMERLAVASPDYLSKHGTPKAPTELAGHDCVFGPGLSSRQSWIFGGNHGPLGGLLERVRVGTADGAVACAAAGLGIAVATRGLCQANLDEGRLAQILPGFPLQSVQLHAVYPAGRRPSLKVRVFVDHLAAAITARERLTG